MNIEKKKRKSCSPCLDNFEKPLEGRDRVFLSLASASSREPGTYQAGTRYLMAETKQKGDAFLNPVRFYFLHFGCAGSSLLRAGRLCCGEQELLSSGSVLTGSSQQWLLSLQSTGLGTGSVVVTDGLVCSPACGILLDWGLNLCPRHWQVDSYRPCHQGTPCPFIQMLSYS